MDDYAAQRSPVPRVACRTSGTILISRGSSPAYFGHIGATGHHGLRMPLSGPCAVGKVTAGGRAGGRVGRKGRCEGGPRIRERSPEAPSPWREPILRSERGAARQERCDGAV